MRNKRLSCVVFIILVGLLAIALARLDLLGPVMKQIDQAKYQLLPTPTPTATPEPTPYVGQVGQRTAYNGWAITVTDAKRSDLNPQEIRPKPGYIDDTHNYVYMDVLVERTIDERGRIDGVDFILVDGTGKEYGEGAMRNWEYDNYDYYLGTTGQDRIAFYLPRTAQNLTLHLSPWPQVPEPLRVALGELTAPRRIELQEAIELGLLKAGVTGMSLENIVVEVSLETDEEMELVIEPGTMFLAPSPDLQSMVVREPTFIFLEEKDEARLSVEVACANMRLKAPEGGEEYIVKIEPPAEELRKLMGLPEFQDSSFRLQQFAIWTYTDKPGRGQYVGLGTADGQGSGPSSADLDTIARWFEAAGLALGDYPSLRK